MHSQPRHTLDPNKEAEQGAREAEEDLRGLVRQRESEIESLTRRRASYTKDDFGNFQILDTGTLYVEVQRLLFDPPRRRSTSENRR